MSISLCLWSISVDDFRLMLLFMNDWSRDCCVVNTSKHAIYFPKGVFISFDLQHLKTSQEIFHRSEKTVSRQFRKIYIE